ncbi:MAG TPA: hypothetical protein VIV66_20575 [Pyrinomonadaceae bacterium]
MAEERTLGLARAPQRSGDEESIEELQRRMEHARDSISNTVTEIKETVANQVQAVKDTLDWREQFKKRPVAWSAGALGVGFVAGYSIAGAFKHDTGQDYPGYGNYGAQRLNSLPAQPTSFAPQTAIDEGPGFIEKLTQSSAYDNLSKEVGSIGNKIVEELSSTAQLVVVPFVVSKLKQWIGIDRIERSSSMASQSRTSTTTKSPRTDWSEPSPTAKPESTLGHS